VPKSESNTPDFYVIIEEIGKVLRSLPSIPARMILDDDPQIESVRNALVSDNTVLWQLYSFMNSEQQRRWQLIRQIQEMQNVIELSEKSSGLYIHTIANKVPVSTYKVSTSKPSGEKRTSVNVLKHKERRTERARQLEIENLLLLVTPLFELLQKMEIPNNKGKKKGVYE
jgi:hypothetical protein